MTAWVEKKQKGDYLSLRQSLLLCSRDEATRTPDPYVPNVVRYQLRYIPCECGCKVTAKK